MSKVITFSRVFPAYHPKAGQPTYFVEKIWKGLGGVTLEHSIQLSELVYDFQLKEGVKFQTIRAGNRWKAGDKFSPRVWSGKPYRSKQYQFAPDIEIKKTYRIEIKETPGYGMRLWINGFIIDSETENKLAQNDGLTKRDLLDWFQYPKPFSGQIICWNDKINY